MADEKWIAGLNGTMSVTDAALSVLSVRLGAVRDRLPAAVFQANEDIEHVHQLRVATRRAGAALRIFTEVLPARLHERSRKTLRHLRRAAGEARDWDVFLEEVQKRATRAPAVQAQGLIFLLGYGHGQRTRAQERLHEAYEEDAPRLLGVIESITKTLESAAPTIKSLGDLAAPMLGQLLQELIALAGGTLENYETLHQVRILGKRLRYAMEIFASCYAPEFRDRYYPAVVEMQDILGLANDSYVAANRLKSLAAQLQQVQPRQWPRYRKGIDTLIAFHEKRLPQQRRRFETWWRAWLKSGAEQAFASLVRAV